MFRTLGVTAALLLTCTASLAGSCGYSVEKVSYKNLQASIYLPKTDKKPPVVIAFGGSEGGLSTGEASGHMLAPRCVAVLALAYFKVEGLPPTLDQIPLEYFVDAIDYVSQMRDVDGARLGMLSGSRGSEAALLVASMDARVKSVVVATPSEVPWQGRTRAASAWTYQGKDIPALAVKDDASLAQTTRFEDALDSAANLADYRIAVERINGPIFFISADKDEIWPSTRMSNDMVRQLKARKFTFPVKHDSYPTGHGFSQEIAPTIKASVVQRFLDTL
jgi:dienelactone hydrolase